MGSIFAEVDSWVVAPALGLAMLAAWEFGLWHRRRLRIETGEVSVSKVDDASRGEGLQPVDWRAIVKVASEDGVQFQRPLQRRQQDANRGRSGIAGWSDGEIRLLGKKVTEVGSTS